MTLGEMKNSGLDQLIPVPGLLDEEFVELAAPQERVWERIRQGELARSPFIHALFTVRTLPDRLKGKEPERFSLRLDDMVSTPEQPGFRVLIDHPPHEVCVGAIGRVWEPNIPFVHVLDAGAFEAFDEPRYVKVAWALSVVPLKANHAGLRLELRVSATDDESWKRFRRYYRLIGPGSRFIRKTAFRALARELGSPRDREPDPPLPGDELLTDAAAQMSHDIEIEAPPEAIWPWLVQMGCGRGGFYSIDVLDNAGNRSAREIHPELQEVAVGDVMPSSPGSVEGFEILRLEPPSVLVLGGLFDRGGGPQLPFHGRRPRRYWHVTWAFVMEPLEAGRTRLHVRVRGAFPTSERLHLAWIGPVHHLMERAQLRNLKARAEGRLHHDDLRDMASGAGGAALMAGALFTPFLRGRRNRWGLDRDAADRDLPGDDLVEAPRWSWTHGIEIDAPPKAVWPWVAQIGANRGGFYSHQWLENLVGVDVRNAERIHSEWQAQEGDDLLLHPKIPPLTIVRLEAGNFMVAHGPPEPGAREEGRPWVAVSWLFLVEPVDDGRSRLVSRFRAASSDHLATRLSVGPVLVEPVGFVMDRQMLLGIKERAERGRGA